MIEPPQKTQARIFILSLFVGTRPLLFLYLQLLLCPQMNWEMLRFAFQSGNPLSL